MEKFVRTPIRFVLHVISPSFFRAVFLGRMRLKVYLSGGQTVKFNCKSFKATMTGDTRSYEFEGSGVGMGFDPRAIIGIKEVGWW